MSNEQRKVKISSIRSSLKSFSPGLIEKKKKKLAYPVRHAFDDTLQNTLWKVRSCLVSFTFCINGTKLFKSEWKKESVDT